MTLWSNSISACCDRRRCCSLVLYCLSFRHSCASQVPTKHRYFATFNSSNYCIFPASSAMKNNCFHQTSYGEEVHQCMVSSFHCIENDSSRYFDTENGFSLGLGKHKNAVPFSKW